MTEKVKVLIGDDSREIGLEWAGLLKNEGFYVITRRNSVMTLYNTMKKEMPDLLIVHTQMEDGSAAELMHHVKHTIGRLPVVLAVAERNFPFAEREVMDAGADCFMIRPSDPEQVVRKVKTLYRFRSGDIGDRSGMERSNLEYTVTDTIHRLGIPAHLKGYHYVRTGIILAVSNSEILECMTKQLYPTIAEQHNTTASRVERAIRHAIEISWDRGDERELVELFGKGRKKPTNSEFIALISDKLRMKYSYGRRL